MEVQFFAPSKSLGAGDDLALPESVFIQRTIPMIRMTALLVIVAGCLFISATTVEAQEAQEEQGRPISFSLDGGAVHQSEVDLEAGSGSFEVDRWFVRAGISYAWDPRNAVGITVGGGGSDYVFYPDPEFGSSEPWGKVEDFRISVNARFKISESVTAFIVPMLRFDGENGADSGDSRTYGLYAAAAWRINEDLTIGPGIGVFSKLDDGSRIFPVLAIDWDINKSWNLSTGRGLAASQGPGLTLGYKASQSWTVTISGRYENLKFRLDDEGMAPSGLGRDQSFPLVISGSFKPNRMVSLALFSGIALGGKLKLENSLGELVEESSYDPAFIIGATVGLRFQ